MSITTGQNGVAADFINESERQADITDDEGRVVKIENDGRLGGLFVPFGFGDGADGDVVLDGTNTFAFLTKSSNEYTLTRDTYFNSLDIQSGKTLITDGYRFFVKNKMTGAGTLKWGTPNAGATGNSNSGNTPGGTAAGGAQGGSGPLKNQAGGDGGAGGTIGNSGITGVASASLNPGIGTAGGASGRGGNAFSGSGPLGLAAGTVTAPVRKFGLIRALVALMLDVSTAGVFAELKASSGGSGGSGGSGRDSGTGGGASGGGGGASGGIILAFVREWAGTFTINVAGANGGAGGNNLNSGAAGGGAGGGAGGVAIVCYMKKTWTGSYVLDGGAGGAAGTGGDNSPVGPEAGFDGADGLAYEIDYKNTL